MTCLIHVRPLSPHHVTQIHTFGTEGVLIKKKGTGFHFVFLFFLSSFIQGKVCSAVTQLQGENRTMFKEVAALGQCETKKCDLERPFVAFMQRFTICTSWCWPDHREHRVQCMALGCLWAGGVGGRTSNPVITN